MLEDPRSIKSSDKTFGGITKRMYTIPFKFYNCAARLQNVLLEVCLGQLGVRIED